MSSTGVPSMASKVAYQDPLLLDGNDLDPVQPDRVGPVLRPSAEHASWGWRGSSRGWTTSTSR